MIYHKQGLLLQMTKPYGKRMGVWWTSSSVPLRAKQKQAHVQPSPTKKTCRSNSPPWGNVLIWLPYTTGSFGQLPALLNPAVSCAPGRLGTPNLKHPPLTLTIHGGSEMTMASSHPAQDGRKGVLIHRSPPSLRWNVSWGMPAEVGDLG